MRLAVEQSAFVRRQLGGQVLNHPAGIRISSTQQLGPKPRAVGQSGVPRQRIRGVCLNNRLPWSKRSE